MLLTPDSCGMAAAEFAPVHSMGQLRHDTNIVYQKSKDAPLKLVGAAGRWAGWLPPRVHAAAVRCVLMDAALQPLQPAV